LRLATTDDRRRTQVIALRKRFLSPAMFTHFKSPVMIVEGKMQYLYDERGRRYLDVSV
jgi:alanine-glyoxylate transaminase/(R)-3-amino-2-methylpropionate-pyruvate transaminase